MPAETIKNLADKLVVNTTPNGIGLVDFMEIMDNRDTSTVTKQIVLTLLQISEVHPSD